MKCPKCQADNPESVKFCGKCGQPFLVELTCSNCGHKNPAGVKFCHECGQPLSETATKKLSTANPTVSTPNSFVNDRYQVRKMLGEGGKKKVYLAHDTLLDRDIAIYLIKILKLDETGRTRIIREAQAMGHPGIDLGIHKDINQNKKE